MALSHLRKFDLAQSAAAKAMELDPGDFVTHQARGLTSLGLDKPEDAVQAFTRSLELDPQNSFNFAGRAAAYERLGKLEEALADYSKALAIDSDKVEGLQQVARLQAVLGRKEAALAAIDQAIALDPRNPVLVGYRGKLLKRWGRAAEAKESLTRAAALIDEGLKKAPKNGSTLSPEQERLIAMKMSILVVDDQPRAAIEVANAALAVQPDNVTILSGRCGARMAASIELELADRDCKRGVEYRVGDVAHHLSRGLLKLRTADWDAASSEFDSVLKIEPQEPQAYYGRGIAKLRKGDKAGGERDLQMARRYGFDVDVNYEAYGLKP